MLGSGVARIGIASVGNRIERRAQQEIRCEAVELDGEKVRHLGIGELRAGPRQRSDGAAGFGGGGRNARRSPRKFRRRVSESPGRGCGIGATIAWSSADAPSSAGAASDAGGGSPSGAGAAGFGGRRRLAAGCGRGRFGGRRRLAAGCGRGRFGGRRRLAGRPAGASAAAAWGFASSAATCGR